METSITQHDYLPYWASLASNSFWLLPRIKSIPAEWQLIVQSPWNGTEPQGSSERGGSVTTEHPSPLCHWNEQTHPERRDFGSICFKTKLDHTHWVLIDRLPIKCPEERWELVWFIEWPDPVDAGHSGCSVVRLFACSASESDARTGRGRVKA